MESAGNIQQWIIVGMTCCILLAGIVYARGARSAITTRIQQMLIITAVFGLLLIGVDRVTNKQDYVPYTDFSANGHPQITVKVGHLCCTGCEGAVVTALKGIPWLGKLTMEKRPTMAQTLAMMKKKGVMANGAPFEDYSGKFVAELPINQALTEVDFDTLYEDIRKSGLAPHAMMLKGIPHFQLVAKLPHFCCPLCTDGLTNAFSAWTAPNATPVPGLVGKPAMDLDNQTVTVEYHQQADVYQLIQTLDVAGFVPSSITIHVMNPAT